MKIGICTFHNVDNYGAVLQTLGSVLALRKLGHQPEIINFFPEEFKVENSSVLQKVGLGNGTFRRKVAELSSLEGIRNFRKMRYARSPSDEHSRYESFRLEHLPLSPCLTAATVWQYMKKFDALYVGSDQIWRKFNNKGWNFFLFDGCKGPRKIAYAASFGVLPCQTFVPVLLRNALWDFSSIGVRDQFSADYLSQCGIGSTLVADPTILVDFQKMEAKPKNFPDELEGKAFLLVYALDRWQGGLGNKIIRQLKRKYQLPVLSIRRGNWYGGGDVDYPLADVGPAEWLWLFRHSAFVCTDSFHGSIFALKYKKNFVTYFKKGYYRAARLADMRRELALPCIVNNSNFPQQQLDYEVAWQIMENRKNESMEFLKNALL